MLRSTGTWLSATSIYKKERNIDLQEKVQSQLCEEEEEEKAVFTLDEIRKQRPANAHQAQHRPRPTVRSLSASLICSSAVVFTLITLPTRVEVQRTCRMVQCRREPSEHCLSQIGGGGRIINEPSLAT